MDLSQQWPYLLVGTLVIVAAMRGIARLAQWVHRKYAQRLAEETPTDKDKPAEKKIPWPITAGLWILGLPVLGILWVVAIFVLIVVGTLTFFVGGCAVDLITGQRFTTNADQEIKQPALLPTHTVGLIKDRFLKVPLDGRDPWRESPLEVNLTFDRSRQDMQYVMNLTYLQQLDYHFTNNSWSGTASVEHRVGEGEPWLRLWEKRQASLHDGANYLHLRSKSNWQRGNEGNPRVGLYFAGTLPDDAVVIRTEKRVGDGEVVTWGPLWTTVDNRPLDIEMKIIILDARGNPLPATHFNQSLPYIWFVDGRTASSSNPRNGAYCYGTFTDFTSKSSYFKNGRQLAIDIPPGFGDVLVLVNLRIR